MSPREHIAGMQAKTMLGRLTTLADAGNAAAAFLASDVAGAMTATSVNLSGGSIPD